MVSIDVLEAVNDAVCSVDAEGRVRYVNARAAAWLGGEPDDFVGRPMSGLEPPPDAWVPASDLARIQDGEAVRVRGFVPGIGRWFDVRSVPDSDGYTLVATEILAPSDTQKWLGLLTNAVEETLQAVAIADATRPGYPIVYVNRAFTAATGYTRSEALGRDVRFLRDDEPGQEAADELWREIDACRPCRALLRYRRKDGTPFWSDLTVVPVHDDGDITHVVGSFADVTDQINAEARLREQAEVLRTLSRRLVEAQEAERRALALELHDEIGQSLTALSLTLQAAVADPERAPSLAAESGRIVRRLQRGVRDLSQQLRPSMIDDLGLLPSLEWLAGWAEEHLGLEVEADFNTDEDLELEPDTALAAYRIVQEALTNAAKYAGTSEVRIEVRTSSDVLEVRVRDEGAGFDPTRVEAGAGLSGIAERAASIGGEAFVTSLPGWGALVGARLPLRSGWGRLPMEAASERPDLSWAPDTDM